MQRDPSFLAPEALAEPALVGTLLLRPPMRLIELHGDLLLLREMPQLCLLAGRPQRRSIRDVDSSVELVLTGETNAASRESLSHDVAEVCLRQRRPAL
jgi:hypothetical protein